MMIDDHGNSFPTLQPWDKMGFHGHKTYNNIIQYRYHCHYFEKSDEK